MRLEYFLDKDNYVEKSEIAQEDWFIAYNDSNSDIDLNIYILNLSV